MKIIDIMDLIYYIYYLKYDMIDIVHLLMIISASDMPERSTNIPLKFCKKVCPVIFPKFLINMR